jgi:hypothetical protein
MGRSENNHRETRHYIGGLHDQGLTLEQAEGKALKGDSNRARKVKKWKDQGLYPYGSIDAPDSGGAQETNTALAVNDLQQLLVEIETKETANAHAIAPANAFFDTDSFKQEIIKMVTDMVSQGSQDKAIAPANAASPQYENSAMQTAIAANTLPVNVRLKRTLGNISPMSLRMHTELLTLARAELHERYQGRVSLNRYIELCLWDLIGRPDHLVEAL